MKLNPLSSSSHSLFRRAPQLAACGALAFGLQVACSDAPASPSNPLLQGTSGSTTTTTGGQVTGTAGMTTAVAGTFASAGTFSSAGTGTGGADTAGTGGQVSGGTGGDTAGTGTAGTGGQVVVQPYCATTAASALPFPVNMGWQPSGWSDGSATTPISVPTDLVGAADACTARVAGAAAVSDCSKWRYTPAVAPTDAWVIWSYAWDPKYTHPNVCLADGAKAIAFCARGAAGGEMIDVGGAGVTDAPITLTNAWKAYSVALGADYNAGGSGVPSGFDWKVVGSANTGAVTFFIDKLQFVKDVPTADYCSGTAAGGTGGTGGSGGGTGGGGAGGGGTGGTGGTN